MTGIDFYKKNMDLRDLQKELFKNGELINESVVSTRAELDIGIVLQERGIKVIPHHMIDGKEFDFKVLEYPILIEIDGSIHGELHKRYKDYSKDRAAQIKGFRVLRFTNDETKNADMIANQILACMRFTGKQPRFVYIYPLSIWEQIKLWLLKISKKRHFFHMNVIGLVDRKVKDFGGKNNE
jgi:very-short-patch-repair endonuclease